MASFVFILVHQLDVKIAVYRQFFLYIHGNRSNSSVRFYLPTLTCEHKESFNSVETRQVNTVRIEIDDFVAAIECIFFCSVKTISVVLVREERKICILM